LIYRSHFTDFWWEMKIVVSMKNNGKQQWQTQNGRRNTFRIRLYIHNTPSIYRYSFRCPLVQQSCCCAFSRRSKHQTINTELVDPYKYAEMLLLRIITKMLFILLCMYLYVLRMHPTLYFTKYSGAAMTDTVACTVCNSERVRGREWNSQLGQFPGPRARLQSFSGNGPTENVLKSIYFYFSSDNTRLPIVMHYSL